MPRDRRNPVSDDEIELAYRELHSVPKVAARLGIGATTITRVLEKRNIARVGLTEYRKMMGVPKNGPYIGVYKGSTEQVLKWYREGFSVKAIAGRIGRSAHVVVRRIRKAGIMRPWQAGGSQHSMWRGGRIASGEGYTKIWVADDDPMAAMRNNHGYVLEHRLVMARKLGRALGKSETVHHVNGDKSDNDPVNLELRQGKHGKHVVMCCQDCGSRNIGYAKLGGAIA